MPDYRAQKRDNYHCIRSECERTGFVNEIIIGDSVSPLLFFEDSMTIQRNPCSLLKSLPAYNPILRGFRHYKVKKYEAGRYIYVYSSWDTLLYIPEIMKVGRVHTGYVREC